VPRTGKGLQQLRPGNEFADAYAVPFTPGVPTLAELTRAALNTLDDDPDGFFLMVEGGAVDRASHENSAGRMIEEQIDFVAAVDAVVDWVEAHGGWERTLVVVTADHETGCLSGPGSACEGENVKLQPVENRGQGHMPGIMWFSGNHSNNLVPFYAKGPGAEEFAGNLAGRDPVRGDYIENISIGLTLHRLWGGQ
jgi:alkaline phosphatase